MPRQKREAKYQNLYLGTDIIAAIDEFSEGTGIPKSRVVENAVREYVERHTDRTEKGTEYKI